MVREGREQLPEEPSAMVGKALLDGSTMGKLMGLRSFLEG